MLLIGQMNKLFFQYFKINRKHNMVGISNHIVVVKREKWLEKKIARSRISYLISRAEKFKNIDYNLSRRYVELAKKISMRYRTRINKRLKFTFCKKCLYPYKSDRFRVRIRKNRVIITCLNCGYRRRIPLS